jgi:hypothetical protein
MPSFRGVRFFAFAMKALPDIPTIGEFVPGHESSGWQGIGVPRDTPREVIELLTKEINAALADPKIAARIAELGGRALSGSPADFGKLVADETGKWGHGDPCRQHQAGVSACICSPRALAKAGPPRITTREAKFRHIVEQARD